MICKGVGSGVSARPNGTGIHRLLSIRVTVTENEKDMT